MYRSPGFCSVTNMKKLRIMIRVFRATGANQENDRTEKGIMAGR